MFTELVTMPLAASAAVGAVSSRAAIRNPGSFMLESSFWHERRMRTAVPVEGSRDTLLSALFLTTAMNCHGLLGGLFACSAPIRKIAAALRAMRAVMYPAKTRRTKVMTFALSPARTG